MNVRTKVIQEIINRKKAKNYLEIGINWGINFLNIFCLNKIGVDPYIRISNLNKLISLFKNPLNFFNNYFEITSDEFFDRYQKWLAKSGLDVIFIDGLHTYEQSLYDGFFTKNQYNIEELFNRVKPVIKYFRYN